METPRHPTDYETGRPPKRPYRENRLLNLLKRPAVLIPLLLVVAFLVILLYVSASKNSQLQEVREQAAQEREQLVTKANQRVADNTAYFLRTLMMPFSWAVRTSLLSGNVEQVDQYLYQFVREQNFELILVADANGKIISTTNQKYKGGAFADHFDAALLSIDSTTVNTSNPASVSVASPVMGLNSRLGTLYAVYRPEEPLAVGQE